MAAAKERYEGTFKSDTATDASNKQASVNWAGVNESNAEDLLSMRTLLLKSKERQAEDVAARLATLVLASSEPHIWTEARGMEWNANIRAVTGNRVVNVTKQKKRQQGQGQGQHGDAENGSAEETQTPQQEMTTTSARPQKQKSKTPAPAACLTEKEQQEQQEAAAERGRQLAEYRKEFNALKGTQGTAAQRDAAGERRAALLLLMELLR
jgi:hypothetical protein